MFLAIAVDNLGNAQALTAAEERAELSEQVLTLLLLYYYYYYYYHCLLCCVQKFCTMVRTRMRAVPKVGCWFRLNFVFV